MVTNISNETEAQRVARYAEEIRKRQAGEPVTPPPGGFMAEPPTVEEAARRARKKTPTPKVVVDTQRQKAIEDMEAARLRETQAKIQEERLKDIQRQKAIVDMKAAQAREAAQKKIDLYRRLDVSLASGLLPGGARPQIPFVSEAERVARVIKEEGIKEFAFGEAGKKFVGVGLPGAPPIVTLQEIKEFARKGPLPTKVVGEFIPTTPGELAIGGGLVAATVLAPPIVGAAIGLGIGGLGTKAALTKELPPESRIAGGIAGALGFLGASTIIKPYVKGQLVKLSPKYKPVKISPEGYQAITKIPKVEKIALIPGKEVVAKGGTIEVKLPPTSPLVRGAYKVTPKQEIQFLGGPQTVATSQRGFPAFKVGKTTKLTEPLFVSMQEPTLKIPETRISRLGLIDLFKRPERIKVSLLGPGQPKIGLEKNVFVTKTGVGNTWKSTTQPSGELQAIKIPTITDVKKIGVTTIKGQAVDIFTFKTLPGEIINVFRSKISTEGATQVSILTPLASLFYPKTTVKTTTIQPKVISPTITKPSPPVITPTIPPSIPSRPSPKPIIPSIPPSRPSRPKITPSIPSPKPSRPSIPSIPPSSPLVPPSRPSPPIRKPSYPTITQRRPTYPSRPPQVPRLPTYPTKPYGIIPTRKPKYRGGENIFTAEIRRFGIWKPVTTPTTYKKAFGLGVKRAKETLGVSVRLKKGGKIISIPTPKGFIRGKKEPSIIIEKRKYRLKKFPYRGEVREIQKYRRAAKRKKKTKKQRVKKIKFF